jgi:hypothetical protein
MVGGKSAAATPMRIWVRISAGSWAADTMPTQPRATTAAALMMRRFLCSDQSTSQPAGPWATTDEIPCAATTMPTLAGFQWRVAVR